jgi:hypothetical protein
MTKPVFHFDKLKPLDIWTLGLYLVLTVGLACYLVSTEDIVNKRNWIFGYALGSQLALYGLNYKSLRNLTVFFLWTGIGILHLYFYYHLKNDTSLEMARGHAAIPLRNTIPLLIIHQLLRLVSLKIQHKELVVPSRGFDSDIYGERRVNWLDFILFILYVGCVIALD